MSTLEEDIDKLNKAVRTFGVEFFKPYDAMAQKAFKRGGILRNEPRMQLLTEYPHLPQISNEYE